MDNQSNYLEILKQILLPENYQNINGWLKDAKQKDKQGLRVIAAVIKNKGKKRFKPRKKQEQVTDVVDYKNLDNEKAAQQFRKIIYGSTYQKFFGRYTEVNKGEAEMLQYKKFSDLDISTPLNQMAKSYIQNWTQLNEDTYYLNYCLEVLRSIYTYLKSLKPSLPRSKEQFFWAKRHELLEPTRLDVVESAVKKESNKNLYNSKYNEMMREYHTQPAKKIEFKDKKLGIDPSEIKKQLMKGNGNLIGTAGNAQPISSTYQSSFGSFKIQQKSKPYVLDMTHSASTGVVIPDPMTLKASQRKFSQYNKDLMRISSTPTNFGLNSLQRPPSVQNHSRFTQW